MINIENVSTAQLKRAIEIQEQIDILHARLKQVLGGEIPAPAVQASAAPIPATTGKRKMSASARAAIGAAQRARWAKQRGAKLENVTEAKPKRKMSEAGRAAIAAGARKRWKKAKAAGRKGM